MPRRRSYLLNVTPVADTANTTDEARDAATMLSSLRVLIVHQWLYTWAGAERDLEQLVEVFPQADVLAGIVTPAMRRRHEIARRARETWVGRLPGARRHHRWFLPAQALAFSRVDTSAYDLIVSISHAFEKAVRAQREGARHICYCLTPPRYLWDMTEAHGRLATPIQRIALNAARRPLRTLDLRTVENVHHFISQSQTVADRVWRTYGRESSVVYPPVAPKPLAATVSSREKFLFTLGRLVPYKRVELAMAAAERLRIPLIVAGDGPDRARLEKLAGRYTDFRGEVSDASAGDLLSRCAAFLFCAEEDFGIAPVEANAHGAPVIAFGRGGARETIIDGSTGVFFEHLSVEAVCDAIQRCMRLPWDERALRQNAARFAPEQFRKGMQREIARVLTNGAETPVSRQVPA